MTSSHWRRTHLPPHFDNDSFRFCNVSANVKTCNGFVRHFSIFRRSFRRLLTLDKLNWTKKRATRLTWMKRTEEEGGCVTKTIFVEANALLNLATSVPLNSKFSSSSQWWWMRTRITEILHELDYWLLSLSVRRVYQISGKSVYSGNSTINSILTR